MSEVISTVETVATVNELNALPVGAVIRGDKGGVWVVDDPETDGTELRYAGAGIKSYYTGEMLATHWGPFTVLYRPDRPVSPELSADDLDRYERIADPIYRSTHVAEQASKYLVSDLGQYVVRLVAEVRALRSTVSPQVDRDALARELTNHHVTRGMQVASGVTCECGYWTGGEPEAGKRPIPWGLDRLDYHRAQVVLAFLAGDRKETDDA